METRKSTPFSYIAGGLFAFLALMRLANFHLSVLSVLWLAGYVVTAVALFMKRRDILLTIGLVLLALLTLYGFFRGIAPGYASYRVESRRDGMHFNLLCVLPALVNLAGYAGAVFLALALTNVLASTGKMPKSFGLCPQPACLVPLRWPSWCIC